MFYQKRWQLSAFRRCQIEATAKTFMLKWGKDVVLRVQYHTFQNPSYPSGFIFLRKSAWGT